MAQGPTQGAQERETDIQRWESRPRTARSIRWAIMFGPSLIALALTFWVSIAIPPERLGLTRLWYLAFLVVLGTLIVILLERVARRFLPLEALFRLSLVFPDSPPSRFQVLLRGGNPQSVAKMLDEVAAGEREAPADQDYLERMLSLVSTLQGHDRLTRGHSERVRGYAETIGVELGLSEDELDKLRWAALLHDVGKLKVPPEILNKPGRPTEDEWKILSSHPKEGGVLAEPLRDWLGGWFSAIEHHHERFDGNGYPYGIAGPDQHLGARIVCVADAYDVMTSTRSYKKPLSHTAARAELAKNSGTQFDPMVVRVMLKTAVPAARWNFGWLVALLNRPGLSAGASSVATAAVVTSSAVAGVLGITPVEEGMPEQSALAFVEEETTTTTSQTVADQTQPIEVPADPTTSSSISTSTTTTSTTTTGLPTRATPTTATPTTAAARRPGPTTTTTTTTAAPTTSTSTTTTPTTTTPTTTAVPTTTTPTTTTSSTTTTTVPTGFPDPDFTFTVTKDKAQFFNESDGQQPLTYSWDLGAGNPLVDTRNADATYPAIGDYEVTLTVTNALGTASVTKTVTIEWELTVAA